jgi:hypothetical protein
MKRIFTLVLFVFISGRLSAYIGVNHGLLSSNSTFTPLKNSAALGKPLTNTIPVPQLGTATCFALFTVNGAVDNTGISNITGNVGANIGAITGFAGLNGTIYNANSVTAQCVTDLIAAYNQISAITPTAAHGAILGNGETLYTGVYNMPGAGSAAGVLTLDAQGDPNAEFIFKIGGAFTTGASTTVMLVNGASASNVYWVAEGAISMAASTTMKGTLIANNAAISIGAGGSLEGRMFSTTGAVSVYGDSITIPVSGFTWTGTTSTNWNTGANWRGGIVPTGIDDCFVGVNLSFTYFPNIPASSGSVSVGSIAFGSMGGQASGVVVNTGSTLIVTRAITYQSDAGSGLGYTCILSGLGTINVTSISVIANSPLASSYTETLASAVANLNVITNIAVTSSNNGAVLLNARFNLTGGTALVTGLIQTTNTATSTSSFIVNPASSATLQLVNTAPLSGLSITGTNVIAFNNTGATVQYSGASQIVYTDAAITGLSGGVSYQNIKFSGTGIKTAATGNLNIAGDYATTLANDPGNYVNLAGPAVNFNGTVQNLAGGPGNGTTFYNVSFSGTGTKTLASGSFYVASTGVLTMAGNSSSTILAAGGLLTLHSDATSSASIAVIDSPGPAITGNVNVERYVSGGNGYRGYRLLSSPVYGSTDCLNNNISGINYIKNSSYITGTTGTAGGFDKAGNPTLYLYRENIAPSNASFISGNYRGINTIGTASNYDYLIDGDAGTFNIPAGNGVLFFFRGDRSVNTLAAETIVTYIPTNTILTASGTLNTGQIIMRNWYTPSSPNLGWTTANPNPTGRGFNLAGNPYASSIDWEQYNTITPTTGIYTQNIGITVYELNPVTRNFDTYQKGGAHTNNGSNIISSGQAFFVQAMGPAPRLIFNESAKTCVQNSSLNLFMTARTQLAIISNIDPDQHLQLQLAKDSANTDDIYIGFNSAAKTQYVFDEDASYKTGTGAVSLASISGDNMALAINRQPLPKQSETIRLKVNANADGIYKLIMTEVNAIPRLFDIWLMDAYKTDSLDLRHNTTYAFNLYKADTGSYGSKRFSLVIRQNPALGVHLLDFTAVKLTNEAQIAWTTENEENYTRFTVERSTDNGKTFYVLGGFSSGAQRIYSFNDKKPLIAANAYRLKLEDLNGVISYSKVITLMYSNLSNNGINNLISIYPNPAGSTINLSIAQNTFVATSAKTVFYDIAIMNNIGSIVKTSVSSQALSQQNVSNLLPGTYVVQVINNGDKSVVGESKFVKL